MQSGTITDWRHAVRVAGLSAPIHPIMVHFTIALFIMSLICDGVGYLFNVPSLAQTGWWTLVGSVLATPLTIATGAISRARMPMEEGEGRSFLRAHMALGLIVLGLLIVMALWRAWLWQTESPLTIPYLAALIGVAVVITVQGYLGGELVYRYGAEVKREYRQLPGHRPATAPPSLFSPRRAKEL
ncbi:DUF2231 domain-containing protein [Nitrospira sp. Nam74]